MKTAAIYIRVRVIHFSQEDICKQMAICQQLAEQKGFAVVKTYIDHEEFGKPSRIQLPQMVEDSRTARWDAVIACSADRLCRNYKQYLAYQRELERNGKKLLIAQ